MEGLFSKLRIAGLGIAHAGVDHVLDMNSIPAMEQRIRDLEAARKDAQSSLSNANFDYQTAQSNVTAGDATEARLREEVKTLMGANGGQPSDAQKAEANRKVDLIRQSLAAHQAALDHVATLKANADKMRDAAQALVDFETKIKARIQELKTTKVSTDNLNRGTKAFESANNAMSAMDGIDSAAEKISRDNNAASDRFNTALGTMASSSAPSESDKLANDDLMASILGTGNKSQQAA